ncbi:DUF3106 domain-containing protein [Undibacterium sp. RTI2.1]|uniref:DUF3106 domain-containing protein n=1 Tax=unclassified Undibacterium TaxID=2630295 RepID=UPI002AB3E6D0|nr:MULTISPECIES: DUF3106 domain-containing protein [unclassified Undibacterium]MDY7539877.1 DUF3106 domain-containing protein [Undibacterium sp. 5I1]MEB0029335.1 DUF3106 domain-containing protein [Undibacterium sp. RTI2.1]MEB0116047.1 DUF3106 domain-containing protein [Undibacterium sp. RTI2.2]MEB0232445.1 DUF3106 domain-containing protein [Undibacterium sp. 10I3]MEB0257183.1 DUF3106 domain-containing protein [Undibacterium sp. 5I1]
MSLHHLRSLLLVALMGLCLSILLAHADDKLNPAPVINPAKPTVPVSLPVHTQPDWSALSPKQKEALTPLVNEWKGIDDIRKKKWVEIANRYEGMKPEEKFRVQERMRAWVKLTPEQRTIARENYIRSVALKAQQKTEQWKQYQLLSEADKERLASEKHKARLTNLQSSSLKPQNPISPLKVVSAPAKTTPVNPQAPNTALASEPMRQ